MASNPPARIRRCVDAQLQAQGSPSPYTVSLMLPHHGARNNASLIMIDLFMPHILGISAGAGTMYNHPDTTLIAKYEAEYTHKPYLEQKNIEFWKNYSKDIIEHYYITFTDKLKKNSTDSEKEVKVQTVQLNHITKGKLPILATGVAGTIYIDKDSYYGQYISYFQHEGRSYKIKFKKAAFEHDRSLEKLMEGAEILGSSKVNLPDNIQKIKYKEIEFTRKKKDIFDAHGVFLSSDSKQLLLPLDIEHKGEHDKKKAKSIRKFYIGHQATEEGESTHEKL